MLRISKNLKIFKRIVKLIAINMMNYFGGFKRSSKMFFYNISMFKDVSPVIRWMIGAKNSNVAMISDITSTLPIMGSPFRGFHLVCMVPILMLLVNLFICTQAEAKIFIKPFDSIGVRSLTDISDICGASEVIQRNAGDTAWECSTVAAGGTTDDDVTVNSTAIDTTANLLDNIYYDFTLTDGGAGGPDDVTIKPNYNAASGDIALLTNEVAWALNGLVSEGVTADTIEGRFAFPDWATSDKVITFQDATHTVVGRDTTDTLTNKTLAAADNVIAADTAVALAANGANCGAGEYPLGVDASGAVESCTDATTEINSAISTHNAANTHVDHTSVTLTAGAGLSGGGDISSNRSFATASGEADFLASGALTCGAGTQGKAQVHTTPLQYCDNAATPALQYSAYGTSGGAALTGDSATAFFSAGTIEHERGGLEADVSAYDGLIGITGGATYNQTGTTTQIIIFDGAGAPTSAALSGDVTMTNGGVVTIGNDKILEAMLKAVDAPVDEECLTYESTTGDFEWQTCGSGSDTNAVKEYWWPMSATLPLEVSDSIPPINKSAGTNIDQLDVLFDSATDECRTVNFKVPSDVQSGSTITFRAHWRAPCTNCVTPAANNVILDVRHNGGVAEGAAPDSALTTVAAAADAAQTVSADLTVTTWTETLANLGWAANEQVDCEFCRDANNASDTVSTDINMVGVGIDIPRA